MCDEDEEVGKTLMLDEDGQYVYSGDENEFKAISEVKIWQVF